MNRRRIAPLVVLAVLAGGGLWWWQARDNAAAGWQGYVDADFVRVGPRLTGLVTGVSVARGDRVAAGAPLFAQDDVDDRAARDEAVARLAQARAQLADLEGASRATEIAQAAADLKNLQATAHRTARDLARKEALLRTGDVAVQAVDQARNDARSAAAQAAAAEAKLAQARDSTGRAQAIVAQRAAAKAAEAVLAQAEWRLAQRHVAAPAAGRIAEVFARPGETLTAGSPVVSLLPPANVLVRFFVPEPELSGIRVGQRVAIGCDSCPAGLTARISFVAPQAEYTPPVIYSRETRAKLVTMIEARPEHGGDTILKPGQPVDVRPLTQTAAR